MLRRARASSPLLALALPLGIAVAGCGAKTGLRLPDVVVDVPDVIDVMDVPDVTDVPDVPDVCVPGMFPLLRREAMAMFVIDRSNSMNLNIDGSTDLPSRWTVLHDALAATLPRFEQEIQLGALFFPVGNGDGQCSAPLNVDVTPGPNRARAVLSILENTEPAGGTPTFEAIAHAGDALVTLGTRATARYIILATDGGPNCNLDLDPNTCNCTRINPDTGMPDCLGAAYNCLDEDRTLAVIDSTLEAKHIPTYVIGIADESRADLQQVLSDMAVHGGRPNRTPGQPPYYSVQSQQDLVSAFNTIESEIAHCAFVTPSRPDDPNGISITVGGVATPRDGAHMNGWDWTDPDFGEITLYGEACARALDPENQVVATVGCQDGP